MARATSLLLSLSLLSLPATSWATDAWTDHNHALFMERRSNLAPASSNLPTNWTYYGCYSDNAGNGRTLNGASYQDNSGMNASTCTSFCNSQYYVFAGTEYSSQCFCGNGTTNGAVQSESSCNMACSGNSNEACGAGNILDIYYSGKPIPPPPSTNPGPPGWTSYGCYVDGNTRTLSVSESVDGDMTVAKCTYACGVAGYSLAGVEYASQCWCDNFLSSDAATAPISECNMLCQGNTTEYCGAGNRLDLYAAGSTKPSTKPVSVSPPPPPGWFAEGCYNDTVGYRSLSTEQYGLGNLTVEKCTSACLAAGFNIAGMEYADECYCDNDFRNGGMPVTDGRCDMPCKGNANETCGGANGLSIYTFTGWFGQGCYNDTVGDRTLGYEQYGLGSMTVEKCTAACKNGGYSIAGVEYGGECYCDNFYHNGGMPVTDGRCNMPCGGNSAEICGGPNGLSIYVFNSTDVVSGSGASSTPAPNNNGGGGGGGSTNNAVPASQVNLTAIAPFTYQGCFTDDSNDGRTLAYQQPNNVNMTIESCVATCESLGYQIAGMEYSTQCFCDNFIRYSPTNVTASGDCNMKCGGNSGEYCGAGSRLTIYSNGTMINYIPPTVLESYGNWTYIGCYTDQDVPRDLAYLSTYTDNNSNQNCLAQCQQYGYGTGGTEYASQCWCGDWSSVVAAGATLTPDSECSMACTNDTGKNGGHYCGAGNRLSLYNYTGAPLTAWTNASGTVAAGEFQFLIGGVIIPLISMPSRTGKITFLEKFGTEPANNSTGAYELDLNLLNNFTAAWRPMHVKSDVFCSAGLTLPDRAGRQINVGGWANGATYGVRLYWPDGLPGVWGTNDWEENGEEVSLITGRWYPTAMIMANGSVLVAGGEVGSNGAPVTNIEVLPSPSGETVPSLYMANPDNYGSTYPFCAVLPSGGILIAYYNEARILDPVTLTTQRVLPPIPGAVNAPTGGRTYPFEGTAMLMPQHAPYTDPLTVMYCGGSVPGPEIALDNCVSIQPDVANATWTIERMPSKRVISCIAALPDGTYLIANGAQQGRAGFGLATEPNKIAVLYDPTKPLNNRMTIMADTPVARLYHSEAVLLDDGRVLISGSDPEDVRSFAPQEYRVEVFIPPYLLGGAPRPSFNMTNNDFKYNESVTISVTPSSGSSLAGYRVSLMAAVASTHGNSMGQRTLFPAISCGSSTCTITTPPNANVAPPAWYQMFVLDSDNIPSNATWIRIGGDPANLGSWPNFPDFTTPGQGPVLPIT